MGVLLINLFVFIMAGLWLDHSKFQDHEDARVSTQNLAQVLEQYIVGVVGKTDLALLTVVDEVGRQFAGGGINGPALSTFLEQQQARLPELESLRVTDAQGVVKYGLGVVPGARVNIADRDYFILAHDGPKDPLVVSKPLFARISKKWAIVLARRINRPDGSFAGVVYVNLALEQLNKMFSTIKVGKHGVISLRDEEFGLVARYPEPQSVGANIGQKVVSNQLRELVKAGQTTGTYIAYGGMDNIERVFSYRKLPSPPYYIFVGLATNDFLAEWRKEAFKVSALAALFFLVTLLSAGLLYRAWKRQISATEILAEQEAKFRTVANYTYDWEYWQGPNQEIRYMTPSCERITGYSQAEFVANPDLLDHVVHPDDQNLMQQHLHDCASQNEAAVDFRILRRDGEIRWIAHCCQEVYGSNGQSLGRRASNRDISQRKQVEEALRDSESRLNELFEHMSSGVAVYQASPDGQNFIFTALNRAAERIEKLQREDLIGKNLVEVFPGAKEFVLLEVLQRVWRSGVAEHFPVTFYQDGRISGWRENFVYKLPSGEIVAIYDDITDQKIVETERDEMLRNQQALLNAIQETTFLIEKQGKMVVINEVGAQRLNTKPEELVGKNIFEFLPPKVAQRRRAKFDEIAQHGMPETFEDERAGRCFLQTIYPIRDARGETTRFAVYAADVTQQRRLQAIDELFPAINQQVMQGLALHEVLNFICQSVVELFQLEVAWVGRKEQDGAIRVLAVAGPSSKYVDELKKIGVRWDDTPQGRGPAGSAIRFGQPQMLKVDDPRFKPFAKAALENNLQSILGIPLVIRSEIYGVFTLCSSDPIFFDSPATLNMLSGIGTRISVALEAAMDQQQIRLLSSALATAGNGVMITDQRGKIQWVNPAFSKLTGYSKEEVVGQTPRILNSGQQSQAYYQALWEAISKGETWSSETIERAKDGNFYTVSQTITPMTNDDGEITHYIAIHEDITAQKLSQERIEHMAHYDALTSLPNRALFYDRLRQALSMAKRNNGGMALLYMDLDGFKKVNDTLGHSVGDLVLMGVADRLRQCVRESDTVARLGGDEFTVILNETHKHEDVAGVAEKIIEAISLPFELDGHEARIGISIGIARYSEEASSEDELMHHADQAMYAAKSAGKNTYRFNFANVP
jgi:diguanylate cyclase (GGDEF)-like protein/PAS domain S-box-containing protein